MAAEFDLTTLLDKILAKLYEAELSLLLDTQPHTPMCRFRIFEWIPKIVIWERDAHFKSKFTVQVLSNASSSTTYHYAPSVLRRELAARLLQLAKYQPRKVLKIISNIKRTADWCEARAAGRIRAAEEITKQQEAAVKRLEEEAAMLVLAGAYD